MKCMCEEQNAKDIKVKEDDCDPLKEGCNVPETAIPGRESKERTIPKDPPRIVYVSSSRLLCAMNGEFDKITSSAVAYAWFVWVKGFTGETTVRWIN